MTIQEKMSKSEKKKKKPAKPERRQISFDEFIQSIMSDIDPAKHAGESWYDTEEYARPEDISSPYTRAEVMREGDYYPAPDIFRKMRNY